jgi:hypothetical protein
MLGGTEIIDTSSLSNKYVIKVNYSVGGYVFEIAVTVRIVTG